MPDTDKMKTADRIKKVKQPESKKNEKSEKSEHAGIFHTPKYKKEEAVMNEKAMDLLKVFDLADVADTNASNLPYGKQRKLEIAHALATSPKLCPASESNPKES